MTTPVFKAAVKTFLGSRHKREAKKLQPLIDEINEIYDGLSSLSDEMLSAKTTEFKERIDTATSQLEAEIAGLRKEKAQSEDALEREGLSLELGELDQGLLDTTEDVLEEILPEAFAVVKDACRRLLGREITVTGQKMTWDMIPYDVQLIGAITLHRGIVGNRSLGEIK